ncbi:MAG TPA: pilin [Candidatus Gracilibacteria bacterium]
MLAKVRTFLVIALLGCFMSPFFAYPTNATVFEGGGIEAGSNLVEGELDDGISKADNFKDLVRGWVNFMLAVIALGAVCVIIWAGVVYITSLGDDGKKETAQKIIIYAVIGLLVIFASFPLVNTLLQADFDPAGTRSSRDIMIIVPLA